MIKKAPSGAFLIISRGIQSSIRQAWFDKTAVSDVG
jgi:hypothetical protein